MGVRHDPIWALRRFDYLFLPPNFALAAGFHTHLIYWGLEVGVRRFLLGIPQSVLLLVKCGCLFDDVRTEMTWSSVKRQKIGRSSSETRYRKSCSKT